MVKEAFLLDNQLCFRLYTASRLLTQAYHPLLASFGLTYPQYLVLLVLWEKDKRPVNDIAKRLYLETNTVTPLLQRMEKEGIILREKGKEDARQIIVTLTPKGKQLQEELGNVPLVIGNAVMCNSITPETVPELFKMLDDMIDRLSGNRCDSSGQPK
ncbi:MAG: winged helix-turn-helix transcriptional regulator [Bacteroidales bacterium]|nr:winged helix-turn-helix transcriptional regulator [Bacteroidales bacterium]